jgi:hypothetical protein
MNTQTLRVALCSVGLAVLPIAGYGQTRPPVLFKSTPHGLQRGTTATLVVEGANIADADRVLFTHEGLSAVLEGYEDLGPDVRIAEPGETGAIIQDKAQKAKIRLIVTARPDVPLGRHGLRLQTPLGTTTFMPIWVGDEPQTTEQEPNDTAAQATALTTSPVTVNGVIEKEGDADFYRIRAKANQDLVVRVTAAPLGSPLDSTVTIFDVDGRQLDSNDDFGASRDAMAVYRPAADQELVVRIADANAGGDWNFHYRATMGVVPVVTSVFPLGTPRSAPATVRVEGVNLGAVKRGRPGAPLEDRPGSAALELKGLEREAVNRMEVALGPHVETFEREGNDTLATAQPLTAPVIVNGRIASPRAGGRDADVFRVDMRRGQTLMLQIAAQRLGSALDSLIEVLDAQGRPVPRARLRAVWETTVDLKSRGSIDSGLRLLAWDEVRRGDFIFVDRELMKVQELPKGPDEDVTLVNFRGRRMAFEDTSPEGHALLRPVYKVERHPPGAVLAPNGLPVFDLEFRNDDGGPMYGKDSRVTFTAPASGTYFIRVTDTRGTSGRHHAYRLAVAPPAPDFDLYLSPSNPNVPRGGRIPVRVFAWRRDGFEGPIDVSFKNLPPGIKGTAGRILPGEFSVALTLIADTDAMEATVPLSVVGTAEIEGDPVAHEARPDEKVSVIALASPPDVRVVSVTPEVIELVPGEKARVTATIERSNGFKGRVPLSVNNLPFRVTVPDIGLNGILITEDQTSRTFEIAADDQADPAEQTLFVTARVETNGDTNSEHSSVPLTIRVVQRSTRK